MLILLPLLFPTPATAPHIPGPQGLSTCPRAGGHSPPVRTKTRPGLHPGQRRSHQRKVRSPPGSTHHLSLIHISEPTRRTPISYAVFCLKKKNKQKPDRTS